MTDRQTGEDEDSEQLEVVFDDGVDADDEIGEDEQYIPQEGDVEFVMDDGEGGDIAMDEDDDDNPTGDDSIQVFTLRSREPIYSVATSHKGEMVVCGGGDDRAFLWSAGKPEGLEVAQHSDSVVSVAFSADDEWIATGGMDGVINVRHVSRGEEIKLEGPGSEIEWVVWHPKHAIVLAGSADTTAWMFNVAEGGTMMGVFAGHTDAVTVGCFTPNGRRVLTGSADGSLKLWEPNGATLLHTFNGAHQYHSGAVVALTPKADEPMVATGGSDGTVCLIRLDTKKILAKFQHSDPNLLAAARARQEDTEEGEGVVEGEGFSVETLAFCSTQPWLVSGGTDGRVVVWDLSVQSKRAVFVHPEGQAVVRCLFLPNTVKLITACADGKVRKYDARSSAHEMTLSGHRDAILDMALLSDDKRVITASDDGTCRVFVVG